MTDLHHNNTDIHEVRTFYLKDRLYTNTKICLFFERV